MPIVFLLLFVYVLGGTLGAGLGDLSGGRTAYVEYVVPGILLIAVAAVTTGTAISVATDMTEGIIARFRTMAIARSAVLSGHVLGRHDPDDAQPRRRHRRWRWPSASGPPPGPSSGWRPLAVLVMIAFALTWVAVAMGTVAKTVETASNMPMFLLFLPFLGSGFVPTGSLPPGVQLVRPAPAVHPVHRDGAGPAARHARSATTRS